MSNSELGLAHLHSFVVHKYLDFLGVPVCALFSNFGFASCCVDAELSSASVNVGSNWMRKLHLLGACPALDVVFESGEESSDSVSFRSRSHSHLV